MMTTKLATTEIIVTRYTIGRFLKSMGNQHGELAKAWPQSMYAHRGNEI